MEKILNDGDVYEEVHSTSVIKYLKKTREQQHTQHYPYSHLKHRVVHYNPINARQVTSYGIIAIAVDQLKALMVQRRYGPDYVHIIKGYYRAASLHRILKGICQQELDVLCTLLAGQVTFESVYYAVASGSKEECDYAHSRFQEHQSDLASLVSVIKPTSHEPEWLFPKGRALPGRKEADVDTALREFVEETGVHLPEHQLLLTKHPIVLHKKASNDVTYVTKYWVLQFDCPLEPNNDLSSYEVRAVRWFSEEDINNLVDHSQRNAYKEARRLLYAFKTPNLKEEPLEPSQITCHDHQQQLDSSTHAAFDYESTVQVL